MLFFKKNEVRIFSSRTINCDYAMNWCLSPILFVLVYSMCELFATVLSYASEEMFWALLGQEMFYDPRIQTGTQNSNIWAIWKQR